MTTSMTPNRRDVLLGSAIASAAGLVGGCARPSSLSLGGPQLAAGESTASGSFLVPPEEVEAGWRDVLRARDAMGTSPLALDEAAQEQLWRWSMEKLSAFL